MVRGGAYARSWREIEDGRDRSSQIVLDTMRVGLSQNQSNGLICMVEGGISVQGGFGTDISHCLMSA